MRLTLQDIFLTSVENDDMAAFTYKCHANMTMNGLMVQMYTIPPS